ncbi:MAG TPA: hypothetical protein PKM13_05430 [Candidatus Bipolaricaulis anaerobius]|nr:hypothetical protein [Candidatus Bipolaricaulis anaerobius]
MTPAADVPGDPDYVPSRIRAGGQPSALNCFGCPDVGTQETARGARLRVCLRSGKVVRRMPGCPKWSGVQA